MPAQNHFDTIDQSPLGRALQAISNELKAKHSQIQQLPKKQVQFFALVDKVLHATQEILLPFNKGKKLGLTAKKSLLNQVKALQKEVEQYFGISFKDEKSDDFFVTGLINNLFYIIEKVEINDTLTYELLSGVAEKIQALGSVTEIASFLNPEALVTEVGSVTASIAGITPFKLLLLPQDQRNNPFHYTLTRKGNEEPYDLEEIYKENKNKVMDVLKTKLNQYGQPIFEDLNKNKETINQQITAFSTTCQEPLNWQLNIEKNPNGKRNNQQPKQKLENHLNIIQTLQSKLNSLRLQIDAFYQLQSNLPRSIIIEKSDKLVTFNVHAALDAAKTDHQQTLDALSGKLKDKEQALEKKLQDLIAGALNIEGFQQLKDQCISDKNKLQQDLKELLTPLANLNYIQQRKVEISQEIERIKEAKNTRMEPIINAILENTEAYKNCNGKVSNSQFFAAVFEKESLKTDNGIKKAYEEVKRRLKLNNILDVDKKQSILHQIAKSLRDLAKISNSFSSAIELQRSIENDFTQNEERLTNTVTGNQEQIDQIKSKIDAKKNHIRLFSNIISQVELKEAIAEKKDSVVDFERQLKALALYQPANELKEQLVSLNANFKQFENNLIAESRKASTSSDDSSASFDAFDAIKSKGVELSQNLDVLKGALIIDAQRQIEKQIAVIKQISSQDVSKSAIEKNKTHLTTAKNYSQEIERLPTEVKPQVQQLKSLIDEKLELNASLENKLNQRQNAAAKFEGELNAYLKARHHRYGVKDWLTPTDALKREAFATKLNKQLQNYADTGQSKTVLDYIDAKRSKFPGHGLQSLLNRIWLNVTTLNNNQMESTQAQNDRRAAINILNDLDPNFQKPFKAILAKLDAFKAYGKKLSPNEAQIVHQLTLDLRNSVYAFICQHEQTPPSAKSIKAFKKHFKTLLHSQDDKMRQHESGWPKFKFYCANLAAAVLSLSWLALTKAATGQSRFFFYNESKRLQKVGEIDATVNGLHSDVSAANPQA